MPASKEQYVVDARGRKKAVLLPVAKYQRLMEDLHDLAVIAERREEKPVSLDDVKKRLRKDGLI